MAWHTARSLAPITGVTPEALNDYNPEFFDARLEADGTYTLIPVLWANQEEFNEYAYGCGPTD